MVTSVARAPVHPIMKGGPVHSRVISLPYVARGAGQASSQHGRPDITPPGHEQRGPGTPSTAILPALPGRSGGGGSGFSLPSWGQAGAFLSRSVAAPIGDDLRAGYRAAAGYGKQGYDLLLSSFNQVPGQATRVTNPLTHSNFYIHPVFGPDNFPGGRNAYYALIGAFTAASVVTAPESVAGDAAGYAAGAEGAAGPVARAFAENSAAFSRILQGSTEELPSLTGRIAGESASLADQSASLLTRARGGAVEAGAQAWKGARALISPAIKVAGGSILAGIAFGAAYSGLTTLGAGAYNLFNPQNPLAPVGNPGYPGGGGGGGGIGGGTGGGDGTGGSGTPPTGIGTTISDALSSPIVLLAIGGVVLYLVVRSGSKKSG